MSPIDKEILMRIRAMLLQSDSPSDIIKLLQLTDTEGKIKQPDQFTQVNISADDFTVLPQE